MRKVVMTKDLMEYWNILHREARWTPKRPYCKLCSVVSMYRSKRHINYFSEGEEVIEVRFGNGRTAYYHPACVAANDERVQDILRLDVDKWNGIGDFIRSLIEKKLADKQIIQEVELQFNCSYTTAWRRLREFKQKLP